MRFPQLPNSTSPAPSGRQTPYSGYDRTFSVMSSTTSIHSALPSHPSAYGGRGGRYPMSVSSEDQMSSVSSQGPMGYPPFDGFEHDGDGDGDGDDDAEDVVFARVAVVGHGDVLGEHACEARSATRGEGRQMNAPMTAWQVSTAMDTTVRTMSALSLPCLDTLTVCRSWLRYAGCDWLNMRS